MACMPGMYVQEWVANQCSKLRIFFLHAPGAQLEKIMHPAIFSCTHSIHIKVFIMCKKHAPGGCTDAKLYTPGSQDVHTGCRVHPIFRTLPIYGRKFDIKKKNNHKWNWGAPEECAPGDSQPCPKSVRWFPKIRHWILLWWTHEFCASTGLP